MEIQKGWALSAIFHGFLLDSLFAERKRKRPKTILLSSYLGPNFSLLLAGTGTPYTSDNGYWIRKSRGLQGDVIYFFWKIAPSCIKSKCGGRGDCGVSANECSCAHHVKWSSNKLRRSTSIFNLCERVKVASHSDRDSWWEMGCSTRIIRQQKSVLIFISSDTTLCLSFYWEEIIT